MSHVTIQRWECDACGFRKDAPDLEVNDWPPGWGTITVEIGRPGGVYSSIQTRKDLCPDCVASFTTDLERNYPKRGPAR